MLGCRGIQSIHRPFELAPGAPERQTKWPTENDSDIHFEFTDFDRLPVSNPEAMSQAPSAEHLIVGPMPPTSVSIEVSSNQQSISPTSGGDGISLITIAPTPENLAAFSEGNNTARTRIFFDAETGLISEADIVINPFPYSSDGNSTSVFNRWHSRYLRFGVNPGP